MDQRVVPQVGRLSQRVLALEQFRAADREDIDLRQQFRNHALIVATAVADRDVDAVAHEVGEQSEVAMRTSMSRWARWKR